MQKNRNNNIKEKVSRQRRKDAAAAELLTSEELKFRDD